jgi:hypothetical protein
MSTSVTMTLTFDGELLEKQYRWFLDNCYSVDVEPLGEVDGILHLFEAMLDEYDSQLAWEKERER